MLDNEFDSAAYWGGGSLLTTGGLAYRLSCNATTPTTYWGGFLKNPIDKARCFAVILNNGTYRHPYYFGVANDKTIGAGLGEPGVDSGFYGVGSDYYGGEDYLQTFDPTGGMADFGDGDTPKLGNVEVFSVYIDPASGGCWICRAGGGFDPDATEGTNGYCLGGGNPINKTNPTFSFPTTGNWYLDIRASAEDHATADSASGYIFFGFDPDDTSYSPTIDYSTGWSQTTGYTLGWKDPLEPDPFEAEAELTADGVGISTPASAFEAVAELTGIPRIPFKAFAALTCGDVRVTTIPRTRPFYRCWITGNADGLPHLEVKVSSIQCRARSGESTYLQVVIPGMENAAAIAARSNGDVVVELIYKDAAGNVLQAEEIARGAIEDIQTHEGGRSRSIIVEGRKTVTHTAKTVELSGVTYRKGAYGRTSLRFATPDPYLRPGDTVATDQGDSVVADSITYLITLTNIMMEIAEA